MRAAARHGTPSGYQAHQRAGERPCDACVAARSDYDARRRRMEETRRRDADYARAQNRALTRLKNAHPDEYQRLYVEAKEEIRRESEAEGR